MSNQFKDSPKLKTSILGALGLANRQPPVTDAEFDSEVYGEASICFLYANLTLTLKVYFEKKEPPASPTGQAASFVKGWGTDPQVVVRADKGYNDGDFTKFKQIVVDEANTFWNGKLWLQGPNTYDGMDYKETGGSITYRPNIKCKLNVVEVGSASQAHLTIKCWRLVSGTSCVSYGSYSDEYDNWDVVSFGYSTSVDVGSGTGKLASGTTLSPQMTVWHEMGHAIGLTHTASNITGCKGQGNNAEYGNCSVAQPGDARNIMGIGNEVTAYNGTPWARRMAKHTNNTTVEGDWKIVTTAPGVRTV